MRLFLSAVFVGAFCLVVMLQPSCSGIEADMLYARRLPGPPGEADWRTAVPLRVLAGGGAVHSDLKPLSAQSVDQDTIHRTSASCHHGPALETVFPVWLRAFYDDHDIYVRLSWPDLTRDGEEQRWVRDKDSWNLEGRGGDGMALVFPLRSRSDFNCSLICHLDDWTVSGGKFRESARMRYDRELEADLWLWRAAADDVLDLFVDQEGIHPDTGVDAYRMRNSRRAPGSADGVERHLAFGPGDGPFTDADGIPLPADFEAPPGSSFPAYLPLPPEARGGKLTVQGLYRKGLWEITLVRPLATGDSKDIGFFPGDTVKFGLSVMDDTVRDHHLVETPLTMKLVL